LSQTTANFNLAANYKLLETHTPSQHLHAQQTNNCFLLTMYKLHVY